MKKKDIRFIEIPYKLKKVKNKNNKFKSIAFENEMDFEFPLNHFCDLVNYSIEKTADEMFKEEYYYKKEYEDYEEIRTWCDDTWYIKDGYDEDNQILFDEDTKHIEIYTKAPISMGLLKAINQKCKELGWIE